MRQLLLPMLVAGLVASPVAAQTYTSPGAFFGASGSPSYIETFETVPFAKDAAYPSFTIAGITYTGQAGHQRLGELAGLQQLWRRSQPHDVEHPHCEWRRELPDPVFLAVLRRRLRRLSTTDSALRRRASSTARRSSAASDTMEARSSDSTASSHRRQRQSRLCSSSAPLVAN
jgi:hypothetical protein